jgi:hypothetical protein
MCENTNRRTPAAKNRMVKKVSGSTDWIPNFPAVDADAHNSAKAMPVRMYFGSMFFNELQTEFKSQNLEVRI